MPELLLASPALMSMRPPHTPGLLVEPPEAARNRGSGGPVQTVGIRRCRRGSAAAAGRRPRGILTWQTEKARGNGSGPATGWPHCTVAPALTSASLKPMTRAKKSDTRLGSLPASWAPAVTVTVPAVLSRTTALILLAPSPALLLARLRASADVVEQSGSLRSRAHFWAMAKAAASAPLRSWVRSAYSMPTSTAMAVKPSRVTIRIATRTLMAPRSPSPCLGFNRCTASPLCLPWQTDPRFLSWWTGCR